MRLGWIDAFLPEDTTLTAVQLLPTAPDFSAFLRAYQLSADLATLPAKFSYDEEAGTLTFQVVFPPATSVSGKTVTASITNGGTSQASDSKNNISAVCPAPAPDPGSSSDSD